MGVAALAAMVAGLGATSSARADEDRRGGWEHRDGRGGGWDRGGWGRGGWDRHRDWEREEWRRHEWRERHPYGYGYYAQPRVYYPPPPVYYAPQPYYPGAFTVTIPIR